VVCDSEDTEARFRYGLREAPFCAFGNRSWLNAYGTSMRLVGEIIGKWKACRNSELEILGLDFEKIAEYSLRKSLQLLVLSEKVGNFRFNFVIVLRARL
jgi:hypothetical protein